MSVPGNEGQVFEPLLDVIVKVFIASLLPEAHHHPPVGSRQGHDVVSGVESLRPSPILYGGNQSLRRPKGRFFLFIIRLRIRPIIPLALQQDGKQVLLF